MKVICPMWLACKLDRYECTEAEPHDYDAYVCEASFCSMKKGSNTRCELVGDEYEKARSNNGSEKRAGGSAGADNLQGDYIQEDHEQEEVSS